jgi:hypothetical protein
MFWVAEPQRFEYLAVVIFPHVREEADDATHEDRENRQRAAAGSAGPTPTISHGDNILACCFPFGRFFSFPLFGRLFDTLKLCVLGIGLKLG